MAEEKIVYLGKDEDLTMVRERLQNAPSQRVVLVVPAQTQLRSRTSWKLVSSWAQELGKDVSVISGDKELRSVVQAAGLRVANSIETTTQSKGRFGRHTGRATTNTGGRTQSRLKTPPSRGSEPGSGGGRTMPPGPLSPNPSQAATFGDSQFTVDPLGPGENIASRPPMGSAPLPQFGPGHTLRAGDSGIYPVPARGEDADADPVPPGSILASDQETAQSIRNALNPSLPEQDTRAFPGNSDSASAATFGGTGEIPEQRASVPPRHMRHSNPDVSPLNMNVNDAHQIEDLGDSEEIYAPPLAEWDRAGSQPPAPEQTMPEPPPMVRGRPPRASAGGSMISPQPFDLAEDRARQVADEPTAILPHPPRSTGKMAAVPPRTPEAHVLPQPGQLAPRGAPARAGGSPDRSRAPSQVPARRRPRRRNSTLTGLIVTLVVIILVGLLVYVLPSATVTVALPSQSYSLSMTYTATASSRLDTNKHTLPSQNLTFTTTLHGPGQATGKKPVGTVFASGIVVFTNNGTASVHVPINTTIQTPGGVMFVTTSDTIVLSGGASNSVSVPVQAALAGASGNVPAGSITTIPPATQTALGQANPGVTISLVVSNPQPTAGGGTGSVATITQSDVNAAQAKLAPQAQQQVQAFIKKNTASDDVVGKPILKETAAATPPVGSEVKSSSFAVAVSVQAQVLVVRAAEIQAAASQNMTQALKLKKPGYELASQHPVQIATMKPPVVSKDGTSLSFSFEALGTIVPQVSADQIRSLVSGKTVSAARAELLSKQGNLAALQNASIEVFPGFIPWVPFWQQRITVNFQDVTAPVSPPKATPTAKPKK